MKSPKAPEAPIGLWPLESRTASVALLHRAVMKMENRVTIGMVTPVFRHGILAMQKAVAANKAALLIVGLVPIAREDLDWLQAQSRDKVIDFVACEHPDYDKDKSLQVGGVGHPSERLHRWWADCTLKALAARGYAVDASVLSSTGQPAVSKTN